MFSLFGSNRILTSFSGFFCIVKSRYDNIPLISGNGGNENGGGAAAVGAKVCGGCIVKLQSGPTQILVHDGCLGFN
jgi:hypothetical protein